MTSTSQPASENAIQPSEVIRQYTDDVPAALFAKPVEIAGTTPPRPSFRVSTAPMTQGQVRPTPNQTITQSTSVRSQVNPRPHAWQAPVAQVSYLPLPEIETKTVTGWQLGRLANLKLRRAQDLFQRGVLMSARDDAIDALHLLAQATDELSHNTAGTEALADGMTAIREAASFLGGREKVSRTAMQRLIESHQTTVLKRCDVHSITCLRAADTYYEFARQRIFAAIGQWQSAAECLVILAKTEPVATKQTDAILSASQVCYLRTALACNPSNAPVARSLGDELLVLGMYDEARWALEHSYAQQPMRETLERLAQLHQMTGNERLAAACQANLARLDSPSAARKAEIVQLSPQQFATISPQIVSVPSTPSQNENVPREESFRERVARGIQSIGAPLRSIFQ